MLYQIVLLDMYKHRHMGLMLSVCVCVCVCGGGGGGAVESLPKFLRRIVTKLPELQLPHVSYAYVYKNTEIGTVQYSTIHSNREVRSYLIYGTATSRWHIVCI